MIPYDDGLQRSELTQPSCAQPASYKNPMLQNSVQQKNDLNTILDRCWLTRIPSYKKTNHQKDDFNAIIVISVPKVLLFEPHGIGLPARQFSTLPLNPNHLNAGFLVSTLTHLQYRKGV
ncbi:hypothetical protein SDJN02_14182, partial [Cucurbita argyrosperma subsp. argyrosperma]